MALKRQRQRTEEILLVSCSRSSGLHLVFQLTISNKNFQLAQTNNRVYIYMNININKYIYLYIKPGVGSSGSGSTLNGKGKVQLKHVRCLPLDTSKLDANCCLNSISTAIETVLSATSLIVVMIAIGAGHPRGSRSIIRVLLERLLECQETLTWLRVGGTPPFLPPSPSPPLDPPSNNKRSIYRVGTWTHQEKGTSLTDGDTVNEILLVVERLLKIASLIGLERAQVSAGNAAKYVAMAMRKISPPYEETDGDAGDARSPSNDSIPPDVRLNGALSGGKEIRINRGADAFRPAINETHPF